MHAQQRYHMTMRELPHPVAMMMHSILLCMLCTHASYATAAAIHPKTPVEHQHSVPLTMPPNLGVSLVHLYILWAIWGPHPDIRTTVVLVHEVQQSIHRWYPEVTVLEGWIRVWMKGWKKIHFCALRGVRSKQVLYCVCLCIQPFL